MIERVGALGILAFFSLSAGKPSICFGQRSAAAAATITVVVVQSTAVTASDGIRLKDFATGDGLREITHAEQYMGSLTISGQPASRVNVSIHQMVILHSSTGRHLAFSSDIAVWSTGDSLQSQEEPLLSVQTGQYAFTWEVLLLQTMLPQDHTAEGMLSRSLTEEVHDRRLISSCLKGPQ